MPDNIQIILATDREGEGALRVGKQQQLAKCQSQI